MSRSPVLRLPHIPWVLSGCAASVQRPANDLMKREPRCPHPPNAGETPSTCWACAAAGGADFTGRCAARWLRYSRGAGEPHAGCRCPAAPSSRCSPLSANYQVPETTGMHGNSAEIHKSAVLKHAARFSGAVWKMTSCQRPGVISEHVTACF